MRRKRLGRPPLTVRHERLNITLPPDLVPWLRKYGNGNLSGAIVALAKAQQARSDR